MVGVYPGMHATGPTLAALLAALDFPFDYPLSAALASLSANKCFGTVEPRSCWAKVRLLESSIGNSKCPVDDLPKAYTSDPGGASMGVSFGNRINPCSDKSNTARCSVNDFKPHNAGQGDDGIIGALNDALVMQPSALRKAAGTVIS